ncbi:MAG: hypothetical protein Q4A75_07270 [Peptostreptococcaceae bacterium]|nr:hypothetical protein [Peptostreptococcaceae bacterium]
MTGGRSKIRIEPKTSLTDRQELPKGSDPIAGDDRKSSCRPTKK